MYLPPLRTLAARGLQDPAWLASLLLAWLAALLLPSSPLRAAEFAKGADIGWLSQMEASGIRFYDTAGTQRDCLAVLKSTGINSVRLRVWVNPSAGWCGKADVVAQARRASDAGLRVMIDFHYSDSWADPGQQTKPAAWAAHGIAQLREDVAAHTTEVLTALRDAGVTPEWIQVGNETNNGMLWEEGRASVSMANFASLVTAGCNAAKAVFPSSLVIVHISNGHDNALFRWILDGLKANGAPYDVIGLSLYPEPADWVQKNELCLANMRDLVTRYGKQVMVSEVGMGEAYAAACKAFLTDLMGKVKSLEGGKGLGLFYWEPACHGGWQGYRKGAFTSQGRPSIALEAFAAPTLPVAGDRLLNISTRARVGTGFEIQVAGFAISGTTPRRVLLRACGPSLTGFGVPDALADPTMELFELQTGASIATNDNWSSNATQGAAIAAAATQVSAFAWTSGSKDAALLLTLAPGLYTIEVKGVGGSTGICLVEAYDAQ